jgi:hypothetical protein
MVQRRLSYVGPSASVSSLEHVKVHAEDRLRVCIRVGWLIDAIVICLGYLISKVSSANTLSPNSS